MIYNIYVHIVSKMYNRFNGTYGWKLFEQLQLIGSQLTIRTTRNHDLEYMPVQVGGGLCNRLKRLVSFLRMKAYLEQEGDLLLYWPINYECNCRFADLFAYNVKEANLTQGPSDDRMWRLWLLPNEVPIGFAKAFPSTLGQDIDFEYERIPTSIRKDYMHYINKLIPSKNIQNIINNNTERIGQNTLGVHVRRRDFLIDPLRNSGTDRKFFQCIDRYCDDCIETMIFLATDCPETQQRFLKRYGNRLITYSKSSYDRYNTKGIHDATVDLFLLAKSEHIIGSYLSTFTEMAWWLGQCKAKVKIVK
jgi:hypothetical protein